MLAQACHDRQTWPVEDAFQLSLNVSPRQLMAPGFANGVAAVLVDTDTNPKALTVDVTEAVFALDHQGSLVFPTN